MPQGQINPGSKSAAGLRSSRWKQQWRELIAPIVPFLSAVSERLLHEVETFEPEIVEHARYAVEAQGKLLRPTLLGLSAGALEAWSEELVRAAVIIEMVHLATLVHDDVMDQAKMRRKRPTLALRCGTTTSVLLGDCLFAHALTLAAQYPTPEICRAVAAATKIVCTGEILQTEGPKSFDLNRQRYIRILQMKTAELFALSCELGGRLNGAAQETIVALRQYGMALGTAYQLYDDCLDLYGDEAEAGKSLGIDLAAGKLTLPVLLLLERAGQEVRPNLERMIQEWPPDGREQIRQWLNRWDVAPDSWRLIDSYCQQAIRALSDVPDRQGGQILCRIAQYLSSEAALLLGCS